MAWVVRDLRSSNNTAPAATVPKQADLNLPPGVIALQRVVRDWPLPAVVKFLLILVVAGSAITIVVQAVSLARRATHLTRMAGA